MISMVTPSGGPKHNRIGFFSVRHRVLFCKTSRCSEDPIRTPIESCQGTDYPQIMSYVQFPKPSHQMRHLTTIPKLATNTSSDPWTPPPNTKPKTPKPKT